MRSIVVNATVNYIHKLVSKKAFQYLLYNSRDFVVNYFKELELKVNLIGI